ncbi:MAG: protein-L-isoaspartate(D-aspartate) O-methyltransferase [Gammaproteobacteria bacterium]
MVRTQLSRQSVVILLLVMASVLASCDLNGETARYRETDWATQRQQMVATQIAARGVADPRVLEAMGRVPRHEFVPDRSRGLAYVDSPLPIGHGQTISQPFIVAFMTEAARIGPGDRVLEIGTGSGYQAAVLAEVAKQVYSIEILEALGRTAKEKLRSLGYQNVTVRIGDGYQGWPERAPFDAILVTAAPAKVPPPLLEQLKLGGRLVMPVGNVDQQLIRVTKTHQGERRETLLPVRFVPMTGEAQRD